MYSHFLFVLENLIFIIKRTTVTRQMTLQPLIILLTTVHVICHIQGKVLFQSIVAQYPHIGKLGDECKLGTIHGWIPQ